MTVAYVTCHFKHVALRLIITKQLKLKLLLTCRENYAQLSMMCEKYSKTKWSTTR